MTTDYSKKIIQNVQRKMCVKHIVARTFKSLLFGFADFPNNFPRRCHSITLFFYYSQNTSFSIDVFQDTVNFEQVDTITLFFVDIFFLLCSLVLLIITTFLALSFAHSFSISQYLWKTSIFSLSTFFCFFLFV